MTRVSVGIACLALGLALTACSTSTLRPIPGAEQVVAEAPRFAIGDEWRFPAGALSSTVVSVVGFEGDLVITEFTGDFPSPGITEFTGDTSCELCWYYLDANLTVARVLDPLGKPRADAIVGQKVLDFPLRVWKEWTQGPSRFKVEAYEEVTVKAGTFKAFRISHDQAGKGTTTRWWSPEVRWFAKFERRPRGQGVDAEDRGLDATLQSYTLKPDTARAPVTTTARAPITAVSVGREVRLPDRILCEGCTREGRGRVRSNLGEIRWIIGEEFEAELKRRQPFPTVVSEGGDAEFQLLARTLGFEEFSRPFIRTRWRSLLALEARLRRPDGSFAWRSLAQVREAGVLWSPYDDIREAFSAAARVASKALVDDLMKNR